MPPKRRQVPTLMSSAMCSAMRTRSITSDSTFAHATTPDIGSIRELSVSDFASLPAKTLCYQLKRFAPNSKVINYHLCI